MLETTRFYLISFDIFYSAIFSSANLSLSEESFLKSFNVICLNKLYIVPIDEAFCKLLFFNDFDKLLL